MLVGGAPVVDGMPPTVELLPPVVGTPVIDGTPPTVDVFGVVDGSPGFDRFSPGVSAPPTDVDGVPSVGAADELPSGVEVEPMGDELVPIGVDDPIDDELDEGGVNCETSGRAVWAGATFVVPGGAGRTRSPRGIPCRSGRSLPGRGAASTNSDAAASAAR